jgi:predicted metalloprotease
MSTGKVVGGIGGIGGLIVLGLYLLMGGDLQDLNLQDFTQPSQVQENYQPTAEEEALAEMVAVTLADTEDIWEEIFATQLNADYREPKLVYFTGAVQSACGGASAATGPFYCPADQQIYIDLSFYQQMKNQLNAPGDFAMAYVVAHEVGHHVQNLLGISEKVQAQRGRISQLEYNELSVKLELQADFLAGLWAHHAQDEFNILEEGDIEEALNAANAIGDDRLQKRSQGYVVPDAFTHGTSAQRVRWFKKGWQSGDLSQGDTFNAASL